MAKASFKPNKKGVVQGTKKKDKIVWSNSKEWKKALTVNALAGNDTIDFSKSKYKNKLNGGDGNDLVKGGSKDDTVKGGKGNDKLYGNAGNDKLYGEAGNDSIYGGAGNDNIEGGDGADTIFGDGGNDIIKGGRGNDIINAGGGKNTINFAIGDGQDVIRSGGGIDTLVFAQNTKVYTEHAGSNLIVHYGNGNDKITVQNYNNNHSVKFIKIGNATYSIASFEPANLSLSRGEERISAVTAVRPLKVTVTNPFDGENYTYTISTSKNSQAVNLSFLENGRLRIQGDYLNITAGANQKDDLILWGNYNTVSTNDLNDIVRIGGSIDSSGDGYLKQSDFNTVNTGAGDDYIVYYGGGNKINGGASNNSALAIGSPLDNVNSAYVREVDSNIENSNDYNIDWFNQGSEGGDCRLLSLILSLSRAGENYNDYVSIYQGDNKYTVTFAKCSYTFKTEYVYFDELAEFNNVHGDLDVVLTDLALNKLISSNSLYGETTVANARYNTLANYFFGNEKVTYEHSTEEVDYANKLNTLWNEYCNNNIKNITIGINSPTDYENGIIGGHAYTLKDLNDTYISLINVWDSYDVLNLDLDTFYNLDTAVFVYGSGDTTPILNEEASPVCLSDTSIDNLAQEIAGWQNGSSDANIQALCDTENKTTDNLVINSIIQNDFSNQLIA